MDQSESTTQQRPTHLFAHKGDLGVGVADLVPLVQHEVMPGIAEEFIAVPVHGVVARDNDEGGLLTLSFVAPTGRKEGGKELALRKGKNEKKLYHHHRRRCRHHHFLITR